MIQQARSGLSAWFVLIGLGVAGAALGCDPDDGLPPEGKAQQFATGSPDIVISQLYGGGGNSGAQFLNDFVELFNRGASSVAVDGWSVQYASATGNSWAKANLAGTIPAGGYYLVQLAAGTGTGASLPAPNATGTMNMSGTSGTVALVTNQTLLACGGSTACLPNASVRDFVGYGTAVQFEGAAAPTLTNSSAGFRAAAGCTDTNSNAADFTAAAPAPRNSSSARTTCGGAVDAGAGSPDAPAADASSSGDGTPTRIPCTSSFGSAMTATFGRLDGFLVSIVNPGTSGCASDATHVHLQVRVNGAIENIAVNVQSNSGNPDVDFLTLNAPLQNGAWLEGWHPNQVFDFVTNLGVHSGSFTEMTPSQLISLVNADLTTVNHISIFTTGFDATGGHLIHRNPTNHDGALVLNPLSSNPQYLLFHFTTQTF
jgi:hypothetical protein